MRDENVVLRLEGICKEFPGVKALQNVEFTLMGENGAGKSTLIKVLTGVYEKDGGNIYMSGNPEPVVIRSTQDAQKAGISTVYQEITLCPNLTVAENMYIGRSKGAFTKWKKMYSDAGKLLESLDIPARPNQQLGSCSLAVQQMVAIARAVDMDCKVNSKASTMRRIFRKSSWFPKCSVRISTSCPTWTSPTRSSRRQMARLRYSRRRDLSAAPA